MDTTESDRHGKPHRRLFRFDAGPRRSASTGVADHIRRFWEPRMRRALLAALDNPDAGGIEMSAIVREALVKHRERLTPAEPSIA